MSILIHKWLHSISDALAAAGEAHAECIVHQDQFNTVQKKKTLH